MKAKGLILLLFVCVCVSCDISAPFVIDGEKKYVLSNECGTIKVKGSSLPTRPILIGCTFNGKYYVNTDFLKIEAVPNEVMITDVRFLLNNEDFTGTEIETTKDETLSVWFNVVSEIPFKRSEVTILLLPSNFITCKGKPIITDTVRIQLKN